MEATSARFQLPNSWGPVLAALPETGMNYQVATLTLKDGRTFERVAIVDGIIDLSKCPDFQELPFGPNDVAGIEVTHDRSGPPRLARR
jgi:hypothetical protein